MVVFLFTCDVLCHRNNSLVELDHRMVVMTATDPIGKFVTHLDPT